jgi:hypothetical protein
LHQELASTQNQNAELRATASQLMSRLEEESEVVSALRSQLVEYKLQMGQMQLQAKKGRTLNPNNSASMFRRPGTATPPGGIGFSAGSDWHWGVGREPAGGGELYDRC